LAYVAYLVFLRSHARDAISDPDRRRAALRVLAAVEVFGVVVVIFWIAYNLRVAA